MAKTAVEQWDTTAANNTDINSIPIDGAVTTPSQVDNIFREVMAQIAAQIGEMNFEGADIASASTTNLATATGWALDITGTTTITGFGTVEAGKLFILRFTGALTLTHNATSLILPGAANITTASGDIAFMKSEGSGNWRCVNYQRASGVSTVGPATSTDNRVVRFNGTAGAIQSTGITVDDSDNVTGVAALTTSGAVTSGGTLTASGAMTVGGAFTSLGIDDNASAETLQLANTLMTLGSGSTFTIAREVNTDRLVLSGATSSSLGSVMFLHGNGHTNANDFYIFASSDSVYIYDHSLSTHTWYASAGTSRMVLNASGLTVDGTITAG